MVEWKKIGDICYISDYVSNGSFASLRENVQYKTEPDYAVLIRFADYSCGFDNSKFVYIDELAYNFLAKSSLEGGEIIMSNVGSCGLLFRCPKLDRKMSLAPNSILIKSDYIDYLYYWLGSNAGQEEIKKITSKSAMPKFNKTEFKKIIVPIPSLSEQNRIVSILDTFTASIENLKEQIAERRKQYEYYRDQLLDFEGKDGVEMKALDNLCNLITKQTGFDYSKTIKPSLTKEKNIDSIPFIQNKDFEGTRINLKTDFYIPITIAQKFPKILLNDKIILISISGRIGNVGLYDIKDISFVGGAVCVCRLSPKANGRYILYFLMSKRGQDCLFQSVKAASHANITVEDIRKIHIPIPSPSEQSCIVSILDTFEASISNLEAQLKEREKQYEYYRNQLLTF